MAKDGLFSARRLIMPKSTKDSSTSEKLQEYASNAGATLGVDREANIVKGVKILGMKSQNDGGMREYAASALTEATPLYENSPVFVDHARHGESRSYRDRNGHLCNVRVGEDGLYADHVYNPKHQVTEQYLWDADNAPANVGFSHDIEGVCSRKEGRVIVESIKKVYSVDLVARPATTRGLFEGEAMPEDEDQLALCEHGLSALTDARCILLGNETLETKKTRLCEVLSVWQDELSGTPVTHKENDVEYGDLTVALLQEHRKDLVEQLTGTDAQSQLAAEVKKLNEAIDAKEAEIKGANDKLAVLEAKDAENAKAIAIAEELKAAKLDASDKIVVSEAFLESLNGAADADVRKRLIEDRVALANGRTSKATTAPFTSLGDGGDGIGPGATAKETLARL